MRLSVDSDDPGAVAFAELQARGKSAVVRLDGQEVVDCFTADEEAGLIVRTKTDADGHLVLTPGGEIVRETLTGTVSIEVVEAG